MRNLSVLGLGLLSSFAVASGCSGASSSPNEGAGGAGNNAGVGGGLLTDSGGGTGGLPEGCQKDTYSGELVPLDMYLMLDKSGSMSDTGKWNAVAQALNDFVNLPESSGIGVGLSFFPTAPSVVPPTACTTDVDCEVWGPCLPVFGCAAALTGDSCLHDDYFQPVVPIADLPGNSDAIEMAINANGPGGGTPTDAALHGAINYAKQWKMDNPARLALVVLATDGIPEGCNPNRVDTVAERARVGFEDSPSIQTFVIGVGSELTTLNEIAKKGGTDQAFIVSGSGNTGQEFLDALDVIRGAVSCKFQIPIPTSGNADPNQVNIGFTPDGEEVEIFPGRGSPSECQGDKGWYYDDPNDPNQIILCPAACDAVENVKGTVDVVIGCETVLT